jgi:tRNA nucleotidyltransferase/poly(A) polymerase
MAELPDHPWQTVRRLASELGARVWPVGGAVRDVLLGREVHDWDFVVDRASLALAQAVAGALGGAYYPLDAERETGRVVLQAGESGRLDLDFALLQGENLAADLRARDLTVNAMALEEGAPVDPTGGQADLAAKRVRATSEHAFRDDPLRLLRAVRVEASLGFEIEPRTEGWLRRDAGLIAQPSAERVRDEFVRLLGVPRPASALERLDALGLLAPVVPEVEALKGVAQSPPHRHDVFRHTLETVGTLEGVVAVTTGAAPPALPHVPPAAWGALERALAQFGESVSAHLAVEVSGGRDRALLLRLAALLHAVGKPATRSQDKEGRIHFYNHELVGGQAAATRLKRLRFSHAEVARGRVLVAQHMRPAHLARAEKVTRRAVYRFFRATSCGGVDVVLLCLADHLATWGENLREERWARRLEVAEMLLAHWFERYHETVDPPALLTGGDLMAELGLEEGPRIGRLLERVREAQAAGEVCTREEALEMVRTNARQG